MKLYIVGAGKMTMAVALALQAAEQPLLGIYTRHKERKESITALLGIEPDINLTTSRMAEADLVLVGVSDGDIAAVSREILSHQRLADHCVVAHLSGCLPAQTLTSKLTPDLQETVRTAHIQFGSVHPLIACPNPQRGKDALFGAFYTLEGEAEAIRRMAELVDLLQGHTQVITAENKQQYHAAAVLASNLVVALVQIASRQAAIAGVSDITKPLIELAQGALSQAAVLGTVQGLTGPIVRGDVDTVRKHVQALGGEARQLYALLSEEAVKMAADRGLTHDLQQQIRAQLAPNEPT